MNAATETAELKLHDTFVDECGATVVVMWWRRNDGAFIYEVEAVGLGDIYPDDQTQQAFLRKVAGSYYERDYWFHWTRAEKVCGALAAITEALSPYYDNAANDGCEHRGREYFSDRPFFCLPCAEDFYFNRYYAHIQYNPEYISASVAEDEQRFAEWLAESVRQNAAEMSKPLAECDFDFDNLDPDDFNPFPF